MSDLILTMGLDVGSSTSKCVVLQGRQVIVAQSVIPVGAGTSGPRRAVDTALSSAGLTLNDISLIAATGYGRNSVTDASLTVSELSCHSKGASWLCPGVRTVIDIGGQDCKVLSLSPNGMLDNFVMNDKCAAGTGRFLEVMARVIEKDLFELGELDAQAKAVVDISSTCTVFAESEVISQLSRGVALPELIAGIHRSVAVKAAGLAKRLGVMEPVFMTGGVSQNSGVLRALERELGIEIVTNELAQLAGAIGAGLFAFERLQNEAAR